jgi:hypothetical protein
MADSSVPITAGSGTPIRVLTALGAGNAGQQVFTLADSAGNLLGGVTTPVPVENFDVAATISIAATATSSGQLTNMNFASSATVQLTGTFVATVQVQVTVDGTNWVNITGSNSIVNVATSAYQASGNLTATGIYQIDTSGMVGVRVITTSYTSGTVTGSIRGSSAPSVISLEGTPTMLLGAGSASVGTVGLNAGTNLAGAVGIGATTPSASYYVSTTTNAATVAKASAGSLQTLLIANTSASTQYVKLFNATAVTLATTAAVMDIPVTAGATLTPNLGANGARFTTGIAYAITGAAGATNNTAGAGGVYIAATYV